MQMNLRLLNQHALAIATGERTGNDREHLGDPFSHRSDVNPLRTFSLVRQKGLYSSGWIDLMQFKFVQDIQLLRIRQPCVDQFEKCAFSLPNRLSASKRAKQVLSA